MVADLVHRRVAAGDFTARSCAAPGTALIATDVRYWPKADIPSCTAHVRFWGESGHDPGLMSAFAVAIGGKADMACCSAYVCF
jgi:hypothetical protein